MKFLQFIILPWIVSPVTCWPILNSTVHRQNIFLSQSWVFQPFRIVSLIVSQADLVCPMKVLDLHRKPSGHQQAELCSLCWIQIGMTTWVRDPLIRSQRFSASYTWWRLLMSYFYFESGSSPKNYLHGTCWEIQRLKSTWSWLLLRYFLTFA